MNRGRTYISPDGAENELLRMPRDCLLHSASDAELEIREARTTDIDRLAQLEAHIFSSDRLSRRSLAALIRSGSAIVLVAELAARLLGFAVILTRRGSRTARLYSIGVRQPGHGTGSRLLAAAETAARTRGAERMRLEVRPDNPEAARFYERAGYQPFGRRADFYEDGMAANLYARDIATRARTPAPSPIGATG
jgi:ribosomal protein S18 acetylase RimI-like enzyme